MNNNLLRKVQQTKLENTKLYLKIHYFIFISFCFTKC